MNPTCPVCGSDDPERLGRGCFPSFDPFHRYAFPAAAERSERRTNWTEQWATLYAAGGEPTPYNDDAQTYARAGAFLSGPGLVEEWGCGTTWGRRFIGAPYRGVDGATGDPAWGVVNADLRIYRSSVPKVLMRHVLEHNWEWRDILGNMLTSFTDRAVLILFIPPGSDDLDIPGAANVQAPDDPPGLQLDADDLTALLAVPGLTVDREVVRTHCPPFDWEELIFMRWRHDDVTTDGRTT